MTLSYKFGEFGDVNPIRCVDSNDQDANITFADPTKSFIYILTENKTAIKLTIDDDDFTISTPVVSWTPTKVQSETLAPGDYTGEIHLQDTLLAKKAVFEFPVLVEKARDNIT